MSIRAIRGAITVEQNQTTDILQNTKQLLVEIIEKNNIEIDNIVSIIFTATKDLDAVYPAVAAREINILNAGLMCTQEMYVNGSLEKCIRVLMNVELDCNQKDVKHVYLKEAKKLRPDLLKKLNIAIDGPAGAGKSTIAKLIANRLNINYVDTGAMYRTMALYFLNNNVQSDTDIINSIDEINIKVIYADKEQHMFLNDKNVTNEIRTPEIGNMASKIAVFKEVRNKLVQIQRNIANENDVVMDGRDIGTFVLPDASLKIFLTASVDARAIRRYNELLNKDQQANLDAIKAQIEERDYRDSNRTFAPLKKANDAFILDTTELTIEQVIDKIIKLISEKGLN